MFGLYNLTILFFWCLIPSTIEDFIDTRLNEGNSYYLELPENNGNVVGFDVSSGDIFWSTGTGGNYSGAIYFQLKYSNNLEAPEISFVDAGESDYWWKGGRIYGTNVGSIRMKEENDMFITLNNELSSENGSSTSDLNTYWISYHNFSYDSESYFEYHRTDFSSEISFSYYANWDEIIFNSEEDNESSGTRENYQNFNDCAYLGSLTETWFTDNWRNINDDSHFVMYDNPYFFNHGYISSLDTFWNSERFCLAPVIDKNRYTNMDNDDNFNLENIAANMNRYFSESQIACLLFYGTQLATVHDKEENDLIGGTADIVLLAASQNGDWDDYGRHARLAYGVCDSPYYELEEKEEDNDYNGDIFVETNISYLHTVVGGFSGEISDYIINNKNRELPNLACWESFEINDTSCDILKVSIGMATVDVDICIERLIFFINGELYVLNHQVSNDLILTTDCRLLFFYVEKSDILIHYLSYGSTIMNHMIGVVAGKGIEDNLELYCQNTCHANGCGECEQGCDRIKDDISGLYYCKPSDSSYVYVKHFGEPDDNNSNGYDDHPNGEKDLFNSPTPFATYPTPKPTGAGTRRLTHPFYSEIYYSLGLVIVVSNGCSLGDYECNDMTAYITDIVETVYNPYFVDLTIITHDINSGTISGYNNREYVLIAIEGLNCNTFSNSDVTDYGYALEQPSPAPTEAPTSDSDDNTCNVPSLLDADNSEDIEILIFNGGVDDIQDQVCQESTIFPTMGVAGMIGALRKKNLIFLIMLYIFASLPMCQAVRARLEMEIPLRDTFSVTDILRAASPHWGIIYHASIIINGDASILQSDPANRVLSDPFTDGVLTVALYNGLDVQLNDEVTLVIEYEDLDPARHALWWAQNNDDDDEDEDEDEDDDGENNDERDEEKDEKDGGGDSDDNDNDNDNNNGNDNDNNNDNNNGNDGEKDGEDYDECATFEIRNESIFSSFISLCKCDDTFSIYLDSCDILSVIWYGYEYIYCNVSLVPKDGIYVDWWYNEESNILCDNEYLFSIDEVDFFDCFILTKIITLFFDGEDSDSTKLLLKSKDGDDNTCTVEAIFD